MKNIWYIILFALAVLLLIMSRPSVDDYLESLDTNWYISPNALDTNEADDIDEEDDDQDNSEVATGTIATGDLASGDTADTGNIVDDELIEEVTSLNGYLEYNPESLQAAQDAGQQVALFFHANRCPSCQALDSDINEQGGATPDNQVLFKVDYDVADELKKQYSITRQHTIVVLDAQGNEVERNTTALTLDEVLELY